jgi:hypothetical protein
LLCCVQQFACTLQRLQTCSSYDEKTKLATYLVSASQQCLSRALTKIVNAMASAMFFGATSSSVLFAAGATAHGVLASRQISGKQWDTSRGGFIGSIRGWKPVAAPAPPAPVAPPPASSGEATAPETSGSVVRNPRDVPIGGATGKPSPPTPFGVFRKHKPTKLPKGHPKPYDPAMSP